MDIHLVVVLSGVAGTQAEVEDLTVILKQLPRSVAVVGIGINDGEAPGGKLPPYLADCKRCAIKVAPSTEEGAAGVMITVSGKNKGIDDLPRAYLRCRCNSARCRV